MKNEMYEEVRMTYREYKESYSNHKTKKDSYDKESKTIIVYVEKEEIIELKNKIKDTMKKYRSNIRGMREFIKTEREILNDYFLAIYDCKVDDVVNLDLTKQMIIDDDLKKLFNEAHEKEIF